LAQAIADQTGSRFVQVNAVLSNTAELRDILRMARYRPEARTILFIDEIHRFNKAQQDALLPGVESGWVTLVGATTENPFFELNAPLLSRCQLVRLEPLEDADVRTLLERAVADTERGLAGRVSLTEEALSHLAAVAEGDARAALSALEVAASAAGVHGPAGTLFDPDTSDGAASGPIALDVEAVAGALRRFRYDRASDAHYDQVSAFIKSIRGSDPDAAVYWLTRMLAAGEDPRFLARRMVILASEDVGLADRSALPLAVAAFEALDRVGLPEARYALTHVAIALAVAPKSNRVSTAMAAADALIAQTGDVPVPIHLRDTHNRSMRRWLAERGPNGRPARTYEYPHDHPNGVAAGQPHLFAVDNEIVVPVNRVVKLQVTAADVLHAFAMPSFALKIDAVPGRLNETWFKAEREGIYYGQCSELCGALHAFMPIAIRVVSDEQYAAWKVDAQARFASVSDSTKVAVRAEQAR
jgi:putative ATPase